jgi:hypothetical protein
VKVSTIERSGGYHKPIVRTEYVHDNELEQSELPSTTKLQVFDKHSTHIHALIPEPTPERATTGKLRRLLHRIREVAPSRYQQLYIRTDANDAAHNIY